MNYEFSQRAARAALNMVALELKKKEAEQAFAEMFRKCLVERNTVDNTFGAQMFELGHFANEHGEWQRWVYSKYMGEKAGESCTSDPLWIAQNKAWEARKLARQKAGYAKAALTRLCRRENGK